MDPRPSIMILIADSGSTKTDWRLLTPEGQIIQAATAGINPNYQDTPAIIRALTHDLLPKLDGKMPGEIHFYGAGCSNEARCAVVGQALSSLFPGSQITVMSDVIAAARSTCGTGKGIAGILGTGSNSCFWDGQKIISQMPCLGFTLGNEGSGGYLGRQLLNLYLNHELPADLQAAFQKVYPQTQAEILHHVYNEPFPNRYIAGFARFLVEQQRHPFAAQMIHQGFMDFLRLTVCKYPDYQNTSAHFVGSIAFLCNTILRRAAQDLQVQVGRIIQSPIAGLALYHQQQAGY